MMPTCVRAGCHHLSTHVLSLMCWHLAECNVRIFTVDIIYHLFDQFTRLDALLL
jgi:hypothetical protein